MKINIYYLYYDLLNVYGDRGNVIILKNTLKRSGIECEVKYVTAGENFNSDDCDILFMGGGQDYEQITVGEDIIKNKYDSLKKYVEDGGVGLYVCGSYQLLGKKYIAADGRQIDGAGILDIHTEKGSTRFIDNVVIESERFKNKLVGFENHSGRTYIGDYEPLGKVLAGYGNNGEDKTEGLIYKNTICTYLHGCCLSKNTDIIKFMIKNAVKRRYNEEISCDISNVNIIEDARKHIIQKYTK